MKARVIWSTAPAPKIPVLAVTRIGGQPFVYVATQEGRVPSRNRRRSILGDTVGNNYAVQSGLNPGEKVIVSGIQFLIDGVPVNPSANPLHNFSSRNGLREGCGREEVSALVDFFIKRPIFATVCALLIILAGAVCIPTLPISLYPNLAPPQVTVTSNYVGANAQVVESAVTIAAGAADQRRRGNALHHLDELERRHQHHQCDVSHGL